MTKEEKVKFVEDLKETLAEANIFYLADTSTLNADQTSNLRSACFKNAVKMQVVKNTLLKKALQGVEGRNYGELADNLVGPTSILFAEVGNAPAKVIKDFRKKQDRPILKGAYIEESVYIGDNQLEALVAIKSKEELLGELIGLLKSPMTNVLSALQSGGQTIAGIVKTLSEREQN